MCMKQAQFDPLIEIDDKTKSKKLLVDAILESPLPSKLPRNKWNHTFAYRMFVIALFNPPSGFNLKIIREHLNIININANFDSK